MNAYLFTALATTSRWGENKSPLGPKEGWETWVCEADGILQGGKPAEAQSRFEAGLQPPPEEENRLQVEIIKISGAQFVECLLAETGQEPIDWPGTNEKVQSQLESAVNDFETGYWVDVDPLVRPDGLAENIDDLRAGLPEDIRSGLNWSPDRQFYFVLTVFTSPECGSLAASDPDAAAADESGEEPTYGPDAQTLDELYRAFPRSRDKEAAALILARNSAVAAWLWRRYARDTRLARNEIRIDPWFPVLP